MEYDGTTKELAEAAYLDQCHRTQKRKPLTRRILAEEFFFLASARPAVDVWARFRDRTWEHNNITVLGSEIHSAIRDHLSVIQRGRCCYCAMRLDKSAYARPIEHILSRKKFPKFSFHFWNLAVSCSLCNGIKLTDGGETFAEDLEDYPIPAAFVRDFHPRFHRYNDHVRFFSVAENDYSFHAYVGATDQGRHLVTTLLKEVAYQTALESNDPNVAADIKLILHQLDQRHGQVATNHVEEFKTMLRKLIATQAAKRAT